MTNEQQAPATREAPSPFRRMLKAGLLTATAVGLVLAGAFGSQFIEERAAEATTVLAQDVQPSVQPDAIVEPVPDTTIVTTQPGQLAQPTIQPFSFADVVDRVAPAVVSVRVTQEPTSVDLGDMPDEMRRFFERYGIDPRDGGRGRGRGGDRRRGGGEGRGGGGEGRGEGGLSMGSGFIIDPAGYIVTNNHVIDGGSKIVVVLNDGTEIEAKLVGTDAGTDIALLKVESSSPLPYVPFGDDSTVRVGDWVVAVGNPFGLGGTVTAGIVSARNRDIGGGPYTDFFQIDAPINRGNSGGPAFNAAGQVIAVNSSIISPSGGSVGIGFAIPSSTVQKIVAQLQATGSVSRGWLGVQIQAVDQDVAAAVGLNEAKGALIAQVTPKSPAEAAGFMPGDIVLKAGGQDVADNRVLARLVADLKPDTTQEFVIWRDGQQMTLTAHIAERQPQQQASNDGGQGGNAPEQGLLEDTIPGLRLSSLTPPIRRQLGLDEDATGVVVMEVDPASEAADKGLRPGDVILAIGNDQVTSANDVTAILDDARKADRKSVLLLVQNDQARRYVALALKVA